MVSKILVTGSNGFVGKALKKRLEMMNHNVIEFNTRDGNISDEFPFVNIDFEGVSHVFHLAAKTFVPDSWLNPEAFYNTNTVGTLRILEICRKYAVSLTYVSSYIYGQPQYLPISEMHQVNPNNPYAHSKFMAEELCEFYARHYNVDISVIRPFNIYGVGQDKKFLIPELINQAIKKDAITVKDLVPKRDFVFLEDLIEALLLCVGKRGYSVYNIGSGMSLSVKEIIDVIQNALHIDKPILCEEKIRKNEIMDVIADIGKAKSELGWNPQYSFERGIMKILESQSY